MDLIFCVHVQKNLDNVIEVFLTSVQGYISCLHIQYDMKHGIYTIAYLFVKMFHFFLYWEGRCTCEMHM